MNRAAAAQGRTVATFLGGFVADVGASMAVPVVAVTTAVVRALWVDSPEGIG